VHPHRLFSCKVADTELESPHLRSHRQLATPLPTACYVFAVSSRPAFQLLSASKATHHAIISSLQHVKLWLTSVLFRRSLRLELTFRTYPAININSCLQAITKDISTPADIAPSALETIIFYCFMGYISAPTYYLLLITIHYEMNTFVL